MEFLRRHRLKLIVGSALLAFYVAGYMTTRASRMLIRTEHYCLVCDASCCESGFAIEAGHHGDVDPDRAQTAVADALYVVFWPLAKLEGAAWNHNAVPDVRRLAAPFRAPQ